MEYVYLALLSFAAGSLLPVPSEALLVPLLQSGLSPWALVATASIANSLGALTNTLLGRYLRGYSHKRWFYFSEGQILRAEDYFKRYGIACLLFTWLPVVGDLFALAAGLMRIPWVVAIVLIVAGKTIRYSTLAFFVL
ncbi:MAG: DedA family protein [Moraxellaceae bacterium]|nr:MAG: DedA family protein [Moraxellaceae bacterium]